MPEKRLAYHLKKLQQRLRNSLDRALLEHVGINAPQYAVMALILEHTTLSSAELARRAFVAPQSMNELTNGMVESGWLEKIAPVEGRVIKLRISRKGRALMKQADEIVFAIEDRALSGLEEVERQKLFAMLSICADNLES